MVDARASGTGRPTPTSARTMAARWNISICASAKAAAAPSRPAGSVGPPSAGSRSWPSAHDTDRYSTISACSIAASCSSSASTCSRVSCSVGTAGSPTDTVSPRPALFSPLRTHSVASPTPRQRGPATGCDRTTRGFGTSGLEDGVGQQVDLADVCRGGEVDQLVGAGLGEPVPVLDGHLGAHDRAAGDPARQLVAEEAVVVAEIAVGVLLGGVAEREVAQGNQPRLVVPARRLPGRPGLRRPGRQVVGPPTAHRPAAAELRGASIGRIGGAADQELGTAGPARRWTDRAGEAALGSIPDRLHLTQHRVHPLATGLQRHVADVVVVGPPA